MSLINTYVNNIMINDTAIDIVKQKTGALDVVFSEATVPAETFAYHKLMGPESSESARGLGSGVTFNQFNAKRNCQSKTEPSDSSIVSLLLKKVQSFCQEGVDAEENQGNNTPLLGEPIRDNLITMPTLLVHLIQSYYYLMTSSPNSLQRVNKSRTTQIGKKHISVTNRSYDQNTSMRENTNTSGCSNQSNIAQRLNFDQREQQFKEQTGKLARGVSGDRLTSMPSPLSKELICSRVINPYATTQVHAFFSLLSYLLNRNRLFNSFSCFYYFKENFTHHNHSSSEEMNRLPQTLQI
ncbi:LOW QUALITY PROTEIN: hypothetical protein Cgig2_009439 [Carnegiea gigantea]|uniref:Uncharacterized protein n=1 Tax=Carnegiea gigantea TaxID=171969 RepID=A0A9Q1K7C6_9CARY|nr:LOW QUALITY PROTEIN: hypothetical protein Cgig2_009439 [Carnegiea gigantea]